MTLASSDTENLQAYFYFVRKYKRIIALPIALPILPPIFRVLFVETKKNEIQLTTTKPNPQAISATSLRLSIRLMPYHITM